MTNTTLFLASYGLCFVWFLTDARQRHKGKENPPPLSRHIYASLIVAVPFGFMGYIGLWVFGWLSIIAGLLSVRIGSIL